MDGKFTASRWAKAHLGVDVVLVYAVPAADVWLVGEVLFPLVVTCTDGLRKTLNTKGKKKRHQALSGVRNMWGEDQSGHNNAEKTAVSPFLADSYLPSSAQTSNPEPSRCINKRTGPMNLSLDGKRKNL